MYRKMSQRNIEKTLSSIQAHSSHNHAMYYYYAHTACVSVWMYVWQIMALTCYQYRMNYGENEQKSL